jgi:hypothetical protein
MAFKKLTKEEMDSNMVEISAEFDRMLIDDPEFDKAVMIIGKFLKDSFMKVGYKRLCRLILSEYRGSLVNEQKNTKRGLNSLGNKE